MLQHYAQTLFNFQLWKIIRSGRRLQCVFRSTLPFHTISGSGRLTCINGPPCPLASSWAQSGGLERLWKGWELPPWRVTVRRLWMPLNLSSCLMALPLHQPSGLGMVMAPYCLLCYPLLFLVVFLHKATPL